MAKGQDEDSRWFAANRGKRQRHRLGLEGETINGKSVAGLPICVTNLGGRNRAWHICDVRLTNPAVVEGYPVCSTYQCQARHGSCRQRG